MFQIHLWRLTDTGERPELSSKLIRAPHYIMNSNIIFGISLHSIHSDSHKTLFSSTQSPPPQALSDVVVEVAKAGKLFSPFFVFVLPFSSIFDSAFSSGLDHFRFQSSAASVDVPFVSIASSTSTIYLVRSVPSFSIAVIENLRKQFLAIRDKEFRAVTLLKI